MASSIYSNEPQFVCSAETGSKAVTGVSGLGDEVFVVRHGEAVYDVRLSLKRRITVAGLTYPYDVASQ